MTKQRFALLTTVAARAFDNVPTGMQTPPEAVEQIRRNGGAVINNDSMLVRSKDNAAMVPYWDLTDAILDGVDAMRDGGEMFMPRFGDETNDEYKDRQRCVKMTNVFRDIVEGLSSKPFEQEVTLVEEDNNKVPEALLEFIEDVDGAGNNLTVFASQVFFSGINSAIHWIFVDNPPVDPTIRSVADQKAANIRPYWSHVIGRNVFDARVKMINGKETLIYVKIYEPGVPDNVRIFKRDDAGIVRWELFEKRTEWRDYGGGKTQFYPIDGGEVTIGRIPLVPFITGRRDGRRFKLLPAMRDAADLQKTLFQNESALEWNKRMGAYSMLSGNGVKPEKDAEGNTKPIRIGPSRVLYAPPDNNNQHGEWSFIQPDAQVMTFLANDNKETIAQLRELGRQPLVASMSITTVQAAQGASKAKSAVSAWAFGLKDALENAMVLTGLFMAIAADTYDPVVSVYTEFDEFTEGKDLEALDKANERGKISDETYRFELKRRRVLSDEYKEEEEIKRLLDQVPSDEGDDTRDLNNPEPKGDE